MKKDNAPSVAFLTLGCKLNQAESEQLAYSFAGQGYTISSDGNAGIIVINTCSVTHIADRKARHLLRFTRKNNPGAFIAVTGCGAEKDKGEYEALGASLVVRNADKEGLPDLIERCLGSSTVMKQVNVAVGDRVRSFIKIQDGCRHFCTYCIVPYLRSREYSVPAGNIIDLINQRTQLGYQEAVLTGTEIGNYSDAGMKLEGLIKRIMDETQVRRLHLSSLQPAEVTPSLLALWKDKRLMPHFHIALQNGSASVLKRMNRAYDKETYRDSISLIKSAIEDASITTDIMVGFPGETASEFEESIMFCREMNFAALHVFSYSKRPGTAAAGMEGQVEDRVKKERNLRMLALAKECSAGFRQKFTGTEVEVLFENEEKTGRNIYSGFSRNYVRVYARSEKPLINVIVPVKLVSPYKKGLLGELV